MIKKDAAKVSHEVPIPRQCSYGQAVLNGKYLNLCLLCSTRISEWPSTPLLTQGHFARLYKDKD